MIEKIKSVWSHLFHRRSVIITESLPFPNSHYYVKDTYELSDWHSFQIDQYGVLIILIEQAWSMLNDIEQGVFQVSDILHCRKLVKELRTALDEYKEAEKKHYRHLRDETDGEL